MENSALIGDYKEAKQIDLPAGFRFHPTDEELIFHYLSSKILDVNFTAIAIGEADFNNCEPWDLPKMAKMGEKEWYFFCLRDRKYPTGLRANRATGEGYWKATGKDKEIYKERSVVGMKKTLVYYHGRAPRGEKTNWIMHEYRLHPSPKCAKNEWVICRVFNKSPADKNISFSAETSSPQINQTQLNAPSSSDVSCMNPITDPNFFYQSYYPINGAPNPPQINPFFDSYSDQNMFLTEGIPVGSLSGDMNPGTSSAVTGYDVSGDPFVDQSGCSAAMELIDIDSIWKF
ncbi:hypothetical protein V2J09_019467 [Rumex salicifolius]